MKPRCGRKLKAYKLDRLRPYDYGIIPLCGRPEGHRGYCLAGETLERGRETRKRNDKRTKETESPKRAARKRRARGGQSPG